MPAAKTRGRLVVWYVFDSDGKFSHVKLATSKSEIFTYNNYGKIPIMPR